jgi:hypothetical protein
MRYVILVIVVWVILAVALAAPRAHSSRDPAYTPAPVPCYDDSTHEGDGIHDC